MRGCEVSALRIGRIYYNEISKRSVERFSGQFSLLAGGGGTWVGIVDGAVRGGVAMHESTLLNSAGRILIVDDDDGIRELLKYACAAADYAVTEVATGGEAMQRLDKEPYDVVVLDLMLPDMSGMQLLEEIALTHPYLIKIILTGNPTQDSAIAAVRNGASDYIRKPTGVRQVLSSIGERLAQRAKRQQRLMELGLLGKQMVESNAEETKGTLASGASVGGRQNVRLQLDLEAQEVRFVGKDTKRVALTKGETAVMAAFLRKPDMAMSIQELVYEALGEQLDQDHAASIMRPIIFRLRQKLETDPGMPTLIRTARGVGYLFSPP